MKVGISTACFYPYINTEDTLKIIKELGFDCCEVFLETEYEMGEDFCLSLNERAKSLDLDIYSVHSFSSTFEPFLFDKYERRKREMEDKFLKMCRAANIFGARCYVFHGLRKNMIFNDLNYVAAGMDNLVRIAKEYNVKIAWENVCWCKSSNPDFIEKVSSLMEEEVYYTLDIKQAVRSNLNPLDYLNVYGKNILNFHINDAKEDESCLLPGEGEIDLLNISKKAVSQNKDLPFIIEVYYDNFKNFDQLIRAKDYVRNLI